MGVIGRAQGDNLGTLKFVYFCIPIITMLSLLTVCVLCGENLLTETTTAGDKRRHEMEEQLKRFVKRRNTKTENKKIKTKIQERGLPLG